MISSEVYSEVYEILKYMNKEVVMKVPIEILDNIKNKRDLNYKLQIDKEDIFNPNNVLPETIEVLNWIDVNFWMAEDKKVKLVQAVRKKEIEDNKVKKQKYDPNAIFSKNDENDFEEKKDLEMKDISITEAKRENVFKKLILNIKRMLHINKD